MKIDAREIFKEWRLEEIRHLQEHKIALASYYSKIDAAQADNDTSEESAPILDIPPRPTKRPQRENETKAEYKSYLSQDFKPALDEWKVCFLILDICSKSYGPYDLVHIIEAM